jgi:hypothetical protein
MTLLKKIINSLQYRTKTPEQIFSQLNDKNILYEDHIPWTWAGIAAVVGNTGAESLRIALENHGMGWAVHQLGGSGLDLSLNDVQYALYALEASGVEGMQQVALSVKRMQSILEKNNISTDIEEVTLTINELKLEYEKKKEIDLAMDRVNDYKISINLWDGNPDTKPVL